MPNYSVRANPAIRPPGPVTDKDLEDIRRLFAAGEGVADTARKTGLSAAQVLAAKKKHGLTSETKHDNTAAQQAWQSKARQNRHARAQKWQDAYDLAMDALIADLKSNDGSVITILKGMGGIESEVRVMRVPARDLRERFAAANIAEIQIQKIDALDDDGGLARGQSLLDKIFEDLGNKEITIRPGMVT